MVAIVNTNDELLEQIQAEARKVELSEPIMSSLLQKTVLSDSVDSFEDAVSLTIAHRLVMSCGPNPSVCVNTVKNIIRTAFDSNELEMGHRMLDAVKEDVLVVKRRDPACESLLEIILFFKGFAALVCHRAARMNWQQKNENGTKSRFVSLLLQSQASAAFGVDIHPGASIGAGVFLDHGTGIVIGETATVGDGCTLLHGVTLGGSGKVDGDRHPKVGRNVLIGANASILGNIKLGDGAKIGAGSVVIKPIPHGATAVGVPSKIIGWAKERKPGSELDLSLTNVDFVSIDNSPPPTKISTPKAQSILPGQIVEAEILKRKLDCSLCPYQLFSSNRLNDVNTVPFQTLIELLRNEGASYDEIGEVFFDLLHDNPSLGYIPICVFRDKFAATAKQYTTIDPARLDCIAKGDQRLPYAKDYSCNVKKLFTSLNQVRSSLENKVQKVLTIGS